MERLAECSHALRYGAGGLLPEQMSPAVEERDAFQYSARAFSQDAVYTLPAMNNRDNDALSLVLKWSKINAPPPHMPTTMGGVSPLNPIPDVCHLV